MKKYSTNPKFYNEENVIFSRKSDEILINCFFSAVAKFDNCFSVNGSLIRLNCLISSGKILYEMTFKSHQMIGTCF